MAKLPKYFYFRLHPANKGTAVEIEDASDVEVAEIVLCKDCKKHNVKMGFDENGHTVWKEDSCPLVLFRGKAQGHEFDYQYCIYGERK